MTVSHPAISQEEVLTFLADLPSAEGVTKNMERINTHANTVILNGKRAYKVKRPVAFPFLDYSTLALRENACKREIIYNAPQAPMIYREALPVTLESDGSLALSGNGTPVEWVVVMNRFDHREELDELADRGPFSNDLGQDLAAMMADAHLKASVRDAGGFLEDLADYIKQNDEAFLGFPHLFDAGIVKKLTSDARRVLAEISPLIRQRGQAGLIRLCHGDAHLRNIVLIGGKPILFDAVEFSDAIATGDVLYDLAFLLMDLWERGQPACANLVFNRYLDTTHRPEDPEGLAALPFYLMMRAAIRSKIAASAAGNQTDPARKAEQEQQARKYFDLAQAFLEPGEPELVCIGGLSGTGKTTLAYGLGPRTGAAPGARVLRTDVERKAGLGLAEAERAPASAYTQAASDAVYAALETQAHALLSAGHSVILDGVFAREDERARCEVIAGRAGAGFCGLWLSAPEDVMVSRVDTRASDASDATGEIVKKQLDYDLGMISWTVINAAQDRERTLAAASAALRKCGILQAP
ncbi:bifunctional aminoglycoside phosphotransferase/ATP-binding protein [Roseibium sp. RKSG952]|uniref:bifunctional aminoglycoside phosphotransferase/ATP-binding protein n=1 Tax=Roseibium sp. RKSG952 TaxID=2529384 RepID=UPI0012BC0402|nr:bifunctional aminoglycoside phosphotransferase/ATP-binding protein [Roseibium sp. RKSG952]MTH99786.1 aminoglycoside phosphotransferase [Roseibium sp. RKSG952]